MTDIDLAPALAKAEAELKAFNDQIPSALERIRQQLAYLQGKVDIIKEMMAPTPKVESPEGENHEPNPGDGLSLQQP